MEKKYLNITIQQCKERTIIGLMIVFFLSPHIAFARVIVKNPPKETGISRGADNKTLPLDLDFLTTKDKSHYNIKIGERMPDIVLEAADEGTVLSMQRKSGGVLELSGNVHLRIGSRSLYADFISINLTNQEIFAPGLVWLREEKNWMQGEDFYYHRERDVGVLYNIKSYTRPFFFTGNKVRQVRKNLSILDQGVLTTCSLDCPHYKFHIGKVWIYGDRKILAQNAVLYVGEIPLFYFPFYYQTAEGSGIVTQFGQNDRRGYYMQNTVSIPFSWSVPFTQSALDVESKWIADFYQRLGEYLGSDFLLKKGNDFWQAKIAYARHHVVDYDSTLARYANIYKDGKLFTQDWYSIHSKMSANLFRDPWGEHSIHYRLEWYNHSYMYPFFEHRFIPGDTAQMLTNLFNSESWYSPLKTLNWDFTYQRKGDNSTLVIGSQKIWQWDLSKTFLSEDAMYLPLSTKIPFVQFKFGEDYMIEFLNFQRLFHFYVSATADNQKSYDSVGTLVHQYWYSDTRAGINTKFFFWESYLSFVPEWGYGWKMKHAFEPTEDQKLEAMRNSYHYWYSTNSLRLGQSNFYGEAAYSYEQSFAAEEVIEPFFHARKNQFDFRLYFAFLTDLIASLHSSYDLRPGFDREEDRWSDVNTKVDWLIDLVNFNDKDKGNFYQTYRLYFARLHLQNNYNYITRYHLHGVNDFAMTFEWGNFSFLFLNHVKMVSFGFRWLHDFNNALRDRLFFTWQVHVLAWQYWTLIMGGNSVIEQLYRYTEDRVWTQDLYNGINLQNETIRNSSLFRLQTYYAEVLHDLHCWELVLGYRLSHRLTPFGAHLNHRLSYYEHVVYFAFRGKQMKSVGITPTDIYRKKPNSEDYN